MKQRRYQINRLIMLLIFIVILSFKADNKNIIPLSGYFYFYLPEYQSTKSLDTFEKEFDFDDMKIYYNKNLDLEFMGKFQHDPKWTIAINNEKFINLISLNDSLKVKELINKNALSGEVYEKIKKSDFELYKQFNKSISVNFKKIKNQQVSIFKGSMKAIPYEVVDSRSISGQIIKLRRFVYYLNEGDSIKYICTAIR